MTLDRYFKLSSYALFATSFAMLAATRQLDWPTIVLFGGVLVTGWMMDAGRIAWRIPKGLVSWLMVGYLPFWVADWRLIGSTPVVALIHFIFFASSFKLLQLKRDRDWLWLYVVAFFEMLLAAGMMIDTTFLLLLAAFLLAGISTMASFEIRRAQQACKMQAAAVEFWKETKETRRHLRQPRMRHLSYFSAAMLALILVLAAPLFLAMPRWAGGIFGGRLLRTESLSGFSDSVRLGDVAQVKLNPQVVMRVRVEQPPEQYRAMLRWRGVTFDYYDGRSWSESGRKRSVERDDKGVFRLEEARDPRSITRQTFYLEPLDINAIFAAPRPVLAYNLPWLARDDGDGLWARSHPYHRIVYTIESDTSEVRDADLRADNSRAYPHTIRRRYLQLPEDRDQRIDELATEIARGATSQLEVARRLENHLRTAYSYTLDLRRTDDGDPVADFLFNVRAGHCEYFATAMTLMLRARGVPARLVNGFQMGEYSDVAEVYTVRQSDAHSWVEVYFPKHGWVAFDPTPPSGLNVYEDGLLARLRHYGEALEMFWQERVIGFDASDQASMVFAVQRWLAYYQHEIAARWLGWKFSLIHWIEAWRSGGARDSWRSNLSLRQLALHPWALACYTLVGLAGAAYLWHRRSRSWRHRLRHDAARSAVAFYQEMLNALARAGYQREPDQTPQEFAAAVGLPGVRELTQLYQRVRFGGARLTDAEVAQISGWLRELKKLRAQPASVRGALKLKVPRIS